VAPSHRGTGLGIRLTENRIAWAREQHLEALYLLTTTAAPFFQRFGFGEVPRASAPAAVQVSREFASACPDSATCMRLGLGGA
jgi:amino-acid N-acetyltransferase